jgi:hypothetical protein
MYPNMKKVNILILLSVFLAACFQEIHAQTPVPNKTYMHMSGAIGTDFSVEMNLVKNNDSVFGECVFSGPEGFPGKPGYKGSPVTLCGKFMNDGNFTMWTYPGFKDLIFKGKFINGETLIGTCTSGGSLFEMTFLIAEKNPEGSIQMNVHSQKGAVSLVKKPNAPVGKIELLMLFPAESASNVLSDSLKSLVISSYANNDVSIKDPEKILNAIKQVYFDTYVNNNIDIYNKTSGQSFNWEKLQFMHIVQNNSNILSYYIDHYAYSGGAHGLQNRRYTVVNLRTAREVKLDEVLKGNYEERLAKILTQKIRENNKIPETQPLTEAGYFVDEIKPASNFYLTRQGIGFFYNQYDIAPYSNGTTELFIPFGEIRDLLNQEGLLKDLVR